MKKNAYLLRSIVLVFSLCFFVQLGLAQRTTIAGWTVPNAQNTTVIAADCGAGTFYADGTNGSDTWTIVNSGNTAGLYFGNSGREPVNNLCEETAVTKDLTFIGQANNDKSIVLVVSTTGLADIKLNFNARRSSTGFSHLIWAHSTTGTDFVVDDTITGFGTSNTNYSTLQEITLSADAADQEILYIKATFIGATATAGNMRMDNIEISGVSNIPTTAQPAFSHATGRYCQNFSLEISCETPDAVIYYTIDGTEPDSTNGTLYTAPLPMMTSGQVQAIAYADGLATSAVRTATFTLPTEIASLSAFLLGAEDEYFKITNDLTTIYKNNNYLFVQDTTAAICIYGAGVAAYHNGDVLTGGVCGVKDTYNGLIELTQPTFINPTATQGAVVEPIVATIAEINANFSQYASRLVTITSATLEQGSFTNNVNAVKYLMQGQDTINCSNQFRTLDGYTTPNGYCEVTGIVLPYNATHRICPRSTDDIVVMQPTLTIVAPEDGAVFEAGTPIMLDLATTFFDFEDGAMIAIQLQQNGVALRTEYIHNASELAAVEAMNMAIFLGNNYGNYSVIANLVNADTIPFTPAVIDSVSITYTTAYVAIETSESAIAFTETNETQTFVVNAFGLNNDIMLTVSDTTFVVTPSVLTATANNDTVTITFVGNGSTNATLTLTSDTISTTVSLSAVIPIDTIIYSTGFEIAEGFDAAQVYNNDQLANFGYDNQQWQTIHGSVAETGAIIGSQSMQMRYYGTAGNAHIDHLGYAVTNFDLHNVTKVEFSASSTGGLLLGVSFSYDGGATFSEPEIFTTTSTIQRFVYNITDSGQYYSVRVKFAVVLPDLAPTNACRLYVDSVTVFGVLGLEPNIVETPVISVPSGNYIEPITVDITCPTEGAAIYYTINGDMPTQDDSLYQTPITLDATCTLKAVAFKGGMDPSTQAVANFAFPVSVANIAEFKEAGAIDPNSTYRITGDVTFVYRNARRIFIEDATGGLLVYDEATPVITNTYAEGDVISGGIIGTYATFHEMQQLVPTVDWAAATTTTTVTPVIVQAADIVNNFATYESRLVRINDGAFTEGATFETANITNANYSDETGSVIVRNQFKTVDTVLETGAVADIIGIAAIYDADYQIYLRTNADIIPVQPTDTTSVTDIAKADLQVSPNPTNDHITLTMTANEAVVEIINAFGQVIYRTETSENQLTISLREQPAGLYFVRMTTADNHVATMKVIKR